MSGIRLNAPVALAQFPGVRSILAGQQVGTFPINENADFGVVDDYEAALGGVSVNLKGQLTVRPNGTYDFDGDYGIEPDRYDFDPKPWGTGPSCRSRRTVHRSVRVRHAVHESCRRQTSFA